MALPLGVSSELRKSKKSIKTVFACSIAWELTAANNWRGGGKARCWAHSGVIAIAIDRDGIARTPADIQMLTAISYRAVQQVDTTSQPWMPFPTSSLVYSAPGSTGLEVTLRMPKLERCAPH
jgi:hypothetical protein